MRFRKHMSNVVAAADVYGMSAVFAIHDAKHINGEGCLEKLAEAKGDLIQVMRDLDEAIAVEEAGLKAKAPSLQPANPSSGKDLADMIVGIDRSGAALYLPKKEQP